MGLFKSRQDDFLDNPLFFIMFIGRRHFMIAHIQYQIVHQVLKSFVFYRFH